MNRCAVTIDRTSLSSGLEHYHPEAGYGLGPEACCPIVGVEIMIIRSLAEWSRYRKIDVMMDGGCCVD